MSNEKSKELADAHWFYIKSLLTEHGIPGPEIKRIEFHYTTAFIHGFKHGVESTKCYSPFIEYSAKGKL